MARAYNPNCLDCGRVKADEPEMFYKRKDARLESGFRLDSYCIPCKKQRMQDRYANETRTCSVPGCSQKLSVNGLCSMHRHRRDRLGDVGEPGRRKAPLGTGSIDRNGYRRVKRGPGTVMEHRHVMEALLGRPLLPEETVHHRNGVRHDNRPENLELWSRWQPYGQRVDEKVAWAKELLALYVPRAELVTWVDSLSDGGLEGPPDAA